MHRTLALLSLTIAMLLATAGSAAAHHYDSLLAPGSRCPGQGSTSASVATQEAAMRCLHNYARARRGMGALRTSRPLNRSADLKAADLMRFQQFSHTAGGRESFLHVRRVGYASGCWGGGENIAWGTGVLGSPRRIMGAWLHSDGHRRNILTSRFRDQGIGLIRGRFLGHSGAGVWVAHLGYRC